MASNKSVAVSVVFVLALLLVTYCVEADTCTRHNYHFHGPCMSNKNCANSCVQNNLGQGGYCKGWIPLKKKCMCTFECPPGGTPPGPDVPVPPGPTPPGNDVPVPPGAPPPGHNVPVPPPSGKPN